MNFSFQNLCLMISFRRRCMDEMKFIHKLNKISDNIEITINMQISGKLSDLRNNSYITLTQHYSVLTFNNILIHQLIKKQSFNFIYLLIFKFGLQCYCLCFIVVVCIILLPFQNNWCNIYKNVYSIFIFDSSKVLKHFGVNWIYKPR